MVPRETSCTDLQAPSAPYRLASLLVILMGPFALGGCETIKTIFAAGFGLGVVLVIAVLAIIGGVIAMVSRKK